MNKMKNLTILLCILFFNFSLAAAQQKSKNIVNEGLSAKLDNQMQQLAEKGFSGVLFIAKEARIVLDKGYGLANKENKTPYNPQTVFDTGSITK